MKLCGIYKITNDVNGHAYVGQAVDILLRWRKHISEAYNKNSNGYNCYFYRAIRKYGEQNFSFKIVELCEPEQLSEKEKYYIELFGTYKDNGYNMTEGGENISCATARAVEQYDLDGNLIAVYKSIAEARRETGAPHIDRVLNGESRTSGGYYWNYSGLGFYMRDIKTHEKSVNQYDLNGVFIKSYKSISDAKKQTGLLNISNACKYKLRCGMYLWTFDGDSPVPYKVRNRKY